MRLASMAADHEAVCLQLATAAQHFEQQLKALRAEHRNFRAETQALRRCLDRAGVVAADELESEVRACTADQLGGGVHTPTPSNRGELSPSILAELASFVRRRPATHLDPGATQTRSRSGQRMPEPTPNMPTAPVSSRSCTDRSASRGVLPTTGAPSIVGRAASRSSERATSEEPRSRGVPTRSMPQRRLSTEDDQSSTALPRAAVVAEAQEAIHTLVSKLLEQGTTPFEQQRAMTALQQLLKRSEAPNSWTGSGTPLSAVVKAGRVDLTRMLLRARANVNDQDVKGVSALHVATYEGNVELCKVLIAARASLEMCDRHGQTPLFFVPNRDLCRLLVEKRSEVSTLNRKGQSALHLAGRAGLHEVLDWITPCISRSLVDLKDIYGATASDYALHSGIPRPEQTPRRERRRSSPRGLPSPPVQQALLQQRSPSPPVQQANNPPRSQQQPRPQSARTRAESPRLVHSQPTGATSAPKTIRGGGGAANADARRQAVQTSEAPQHSEQSSAPQSGLWSYPAASPSSPEELAEERRLGSAIWVQSRLSGQGRLKSFGLEDCSVAPNSHHLEAMPTGENSNGCQPDAGEVNNATALEAAAAVATAAMATAAQLEPLQQQSQQQWQQQQHWQSPEMNTAHELSPPQLGDLTQSSMLTSEGMQEHGPANGQRRSWQYQANGTLQAYMSQLGSDVDTKQTTEEVAPDMADPVSQEVSTPQHMNKDNAVTPDMVDPVGQEASAPRRMSKEEFEEIGILGMEDDDDYNLSDHAEPVASAAATTLEPHAEQDEDDDYTFSDVAEPSAVLTRQNQASELDVVATKTDESDEVF